MKTYREQLAERANHAVKTSGKGIVIPTAYKRSCYWEFRANQNDLWGRIKTAWYCLNFDDDYLDKLLTHFGY